MYLFLVSTLIRSLPLVDHDILTVGTTRGGIRNGRYGERVCDERRGESVCDKRYGKRVCDER